MKSTLTTSLTILLPPVALLLFGASSLAAQEVTRTGWQMHKGKGVFKLSEKLPSHGHNDKAYQHANIPKENDPGWKAADDPDIIGFERDSEIPGKANDPVTCLLNVDYTYFQTFVTVPDGVDVTQFEIDFSGMDDGSRVSVNGEVDDNSYVKLHGKHTANLKKYIKPGRNRIVITQVDDCPNKNNLKSAKVKLNNLIVEPAPSCNNSWGDVHIRTPDGLLYDYQGTGEYLALRSKDGQAVVQARQENPSENSKVSVNTAVALNVNGASVSLYAKPSLSLEIDKKPKTLSKPFHLPKGGTIKQSNEGSYQQFVVKWPAPTKLVFCARVYKSSHIDFGVSTSAQSKTKYEGFLGNIDGNGKNDLQTSKGKAFTLPTTSAELVEFFKSWCVTSDKSLFSKPTSLTCTGPDGPIALADLPHLADAREACKGVTDSTLRENCETDVGGTGNVKFAESALLVQTAQAAAPMTAVVAAPEQYTMSTLVGQWIFYGKEGSLKDQAKYWDDVALQGIDFRRRGLPVGKDRWALAAGYQGPEIGAKTLIAWVRLNDQALGTGPSADAGAALSLDAIKEDQFDAIVFGELHEDTWMAGSSDYVRTRKTDDRPKTIKAGEVVKMAITYEPAGKEKTMIKIYQNGELKVSYEGGALARWKEGNAEVLFGTRHTPDGQPRGFLDATILKAEIHNVALSAEQIKGR